MSYRSLHSGGVWDLWDFTPFEFSYLQQTSSSIYVETFKNFNYCEPFKAFHSVNFLIGESVATAFRFLKADNNYSFNLGSLIFYCLVQQSQEEIEVYPVFPCSIPFL